MNEKSVKFDKTFGSTFKKLRSSKNFSQEQAAEGVMDKGQLSRFENGQVMPGFDKVVEMLKNINVTLLEFDNAHNHFLQQQDTLLYDTAITDAYLSQDVEKLKLILAEIENEIKLSPLRKKYRIDKYHVEAVMKMLDSDYIILSDDLTALKDYLMKLKEWGLYDIHLFGHCVSVFPSEDFGNLVEKMLFCTENASNLHYIEHAVIQAMLSVIDSCLSRGEFGYAKTFINHLKRLKIHDYFMYEKFTLKYNEASYEYQIGKISALKTMEKCREFALFCDCLPTAALITGEITALKAKIV